LAATERAIPRYLGGDGEPGHPRATGILKQSRPFQRLFENGGVYAPQAAFPSGPRTGQAQLVLFFERGYFRPPSFFARRACRQGVTSLGRERRWASKNKGTGVVKGVSLFVARTHGPASPPGGDWTRLPERSKAPQGKTNKKRFEQALRSAGGTAIFFKARIRNFVFPLKSLGGRRRVRITQTGRDTFLSASLVDSHRRTIRGTPSTTLIGHRFSESAAPPRPAATRSSLLYVWRRLSIVRLARVPGRLIDQRPPPSPCGDDGGPWTRFRPSRSSLLLRNRTFDRRVSNPPKIRALGSSTRSVQQGEDLTIECGKGWPS